MIKILNRIVSNRAEFRTKSWGAGENTEVAEVKGPRILFCRLYKIAKGAPGPFASTLSSAGWRRHTTPNTIWASAHLLNIGVHSSNNI